MARFWPFRRRADDQRVRTSGPPRSPNGGSSFHVWWDVHGPLSSVSAVLEVGLPAEVKGVAFFALQASFGTSQGHTGGAHTGLQCNPRHPEGRAVNWGGYDRQGIILQGSLSPLNSLPNDPNTRDFHWNPGNRYRFTIGPRSIRNDQVCWPARVEGLDSGEDVVIRELFCPGDFLLSPVMWSEVFCHCEHPSLAARWSQPTVVTLDGDTKPVTQGRANYQSYKKGGCTNTNILVREHGVEQHTNQPRTTPDQAVVYWGQ